MNAISGITNYNAQQPEDPAYVLWSLHLHPPAFPVQTVYVPPLKDCSAKSEAPKCVLPPPPTSHAILGMPAV